MVSTYHDRGICFQYPANWKLEQEETERGWTLLLQSPNTTFFLISCDYGIPPTEQVLHTVREALKADYPDLEIVDRMETLAGAPAPGYDIQFISLDLTNTCCVRSFYSEEGTLLVMWQGADIDLETTGPVLRAICKSLELEEEE